MALCNVKGGTMTIEVLSRQFSICRLAKAPAPSELTEFCFFSATYEELSLLCPTSCAPADALQREDGYRGFRFAGTLDFGLIGILARATAILADKKNTGVCGFHLQHRLYLCERRFLFKRPGSDEGKWLRDKGKLHPLMLPANKPETKCFCASMNTM